MFYFLSMTLDHLKHSAILSSLFKMADDNDLIGASEFIRGKGNLRRDEVGVPVGDSIPCCRGVSATLLLPVNSK